MKFISNGSIAKLKPLNYKAVECLLALIERAKLRNPTALQFLDSIPYKAYTYVLDTESRKSTTVHTSIWTPSIIHIYGDGTTLNTDLEIGRLMLVRLFDMLKCFNNVASHKHKPLATLFNRMIYGPDRSFDGFEDLRFYCVDMESCYTNLSKMINISPSQRLALEAVYTEAYGVCFEDTKEFFNSIQGVSNG